MTPQLLLQPTVLFLLPVSLVVSLVVDDGVDRDTGTGFMDHLIGVISIKVRELRAVDDVDSAGTGLGGGSFVVACGVGPGVVDRGGRERFVWDDCLRGGGGGFCGGLFRVSGCYLGVSRERVRCVNWGWERYDAMDDDGKGGRWVCEAR